MIILDAHVKSIAYCLSQFFGAILFHTLSLLVRSVQHLCGTELEDWSLKARRVPIRHVSVTAQSIFSMLLRESKEQ